MSFLETYLLLIIFSTISLSIVYVRIYARCQTSFLFLGERPPLLCTASGNLICEQETRVKHIIMHERITVRFLYFLSIIKLATRNLLIPTPPKNFCNNKKILPLYSIMKKHINYEFSTSDCPLKNCLPTIQISQHHQQRQYPIALQLQLLQLFFLIVVYEFRPFIPQKDVN